MAYEKEIEIIKYYLNTFSLLVINSLFPYVFVLFFWELV